eukprot:18925-Heterococcus_DN1.PRE.1
MSTVPTVTTIAHKAVDISAAREKGQSAVILLQVANVKVQLYSNAHQDARATVSGTPLPRHTTLIGTSVSETSSPTLPLYIITFFRPVLRLAD